MPFLIEIILNALAVFVVSLILPGVEVENFMIAVAVAIVLAFVNAFVRPLLFFLTLPINVLTFGLFTFVVIGFSVLIVSWLIPGFSVDNIFWALLFALLVSVFASFLRSLKRMHHK